MKHQESNTNPCSPRHHPSETAQMGKFFSNLWLKKKNHITINKVIYPDKPKHLMVSMLYIYQAHR